MKDTGYIIKNGDGVYYYGKNYSVKGFGKTLRKAKIYGNLRYANDAIKTITEDEWCCRHYASNWGVVTVEIQECNDEKGGR